MREVTVALDAGDPAAAREALGYAPDMVDILADGAVAARSAAAPSDMMEVSRTRCAAPATILSGIRELH